MKTIKAKPISYGDKRDRKNIKYIVIHYTAGNGDTAVNEGNYFKNVNDRAAGAHFFVDQKGDTVKSIPMNRIAWAVGGSIYKDYKVTGGGKYYKICTNSNSVSIELCDNAKKDPSDAQIKAVKKLIKFIRFWCPNAKTVIRHFDVTGKSCLPIEETELLTPDGWRYLKDIRKGEVVCQYDAEKNVLNFTKVLDVVKQHSADVIENHRFVATPDHNMFLKPNCANSKEYRNVLWGEALTGKGLFAVKTGAQIETDGLNLTDNELRLLVWIQGDGHYMLTKSGNISGLEFHLKKERKITRIKSLLEVMNIHYTTSVCSNGSEHIRIWSNEIVQWAETWLDDKCYTYTFINLSEHQFDVFREEMVNVDGCKSGRNELYTSLLPQNLDVVQAMCATHGVRTNQTNLGADYRCAVAFHNTNYTFSGRTETKKRKAIVSCVTVPTGYILVRQNWRTFIVGNCPARMVEDKKWKEFLKKIGE